ncbi:glycosyltransferase [Hymenobacter sp. BT770]|uniref:glycosyltransferase n=1 Tax=Hymenobacter sp. BT770 TaxID=2886942 RepID=UPI001D107388|nr:glycosyltransferase [Hymenobacter sp. BT770]MCC3151515.1 glycosyltransferase [Hymenobacter sp. BT770]MDO3413909.1 glycosyltransferase [Hymenobacter sp. BT770]
MEHAAPARFLGSHEATAPGPQVQVNFRPAVPRRGRHAELLHRQLPPPHAGLQVCVIIPAKNEADSLPATLAALAAQTDWHGQPLPPGSYEVIVLANNCTDATAAVVRQQAKRYPHLPLHVASLYLPKPHAHVGRARCLLMDVACARLQQVGSTAGIIASTDADTRVAPTWVAAIQAEIAAGADAVGGRILTEINAPALLPLRRIKDRDTAYRLMCARLEDLIDPNPADPWPRHHQHFGASLALTARAYCQVGGLPAVRFLEDEALCQALLRHDLAVRHSPRVQVLTSGRQQGRVEVGLSWQLREWLRMSQRQYEPQVDNPLQLAALWQARRHLRHRWAGCSPRRLDALAICLGLPAATLLAHMQAAATFGELWEAVLPTARSAAVSAIPLSQALRMLPQLIRHYQPRGEALGAAYAEASVFPEGRGDSSRAVAR